jgi:hypothetical protein
MEPIKATSQIQTLESGSRIVAVDVGSCVVTFNARRGKAFRVVATDWREATSPANAKTAWESACAKVLEQDSAAQFEAPIF